MIITDYKIHPKTELINVIRNTYLAGDHNIHPFADSKINIESVSAADLIPTQAFVLNEQLQTIDAIRRQMMTHGVDIFHQDGFLSYHIHGTQSNFVFTPPLVEVIDGLPLIIDGQHRITYAQDHNMTFNALIIQGIDKSVYPYQLPLNGGWDAVHRFDTKLPDGFVRKSRRYPGGTHKYYFREYPFPGIIKLAREHTGR